MFDIIDYECDQALSCKNSGSVVGDARAKCHLCRLSPISENRGSIYWKPLNGKDKHPVLTQEKFQKDLERRKTAIAKRQNRDKSKMKISWKAAKSEKAVGENVIKATKNSGRQSMDGDFSVKNLITLDNKLQTTKTVPEVDLGELDKVNADAKRGGNLIGGLVITNKNGVQVVVFKLEDFSREILSRL